MSDVDYDEINSLSLHDKVKRLYEAQAGKKHLIDEFRKTNRAYLALSQEEEFIKALLRL